MQNIFKNKTILVTGGTGSFGSAIVKELLRYEPKAIRIYANDEDALFNTQQQLQHKKLRFFLGDIRDKERLSRAMDDLDIIFHTAALKHVLICEYNPFEAVKTNIIAIQNIIDLAIDNDIKKVIFTSSDKATNPSSLMGTTKLLGEKLMITANFFKGKHETAFSCVRFGNILGSRGSVIPLFKQQIKNGGPMTITDSNMTRFVLSMHQAVNLVLKATEIAVGGEIFILKMDALNINDLLDVMLEGLVPKYGINPKKIEVQKVGIRPGEKFYEELMTEEELIRALELEDMFVVLPQTSEFQTLDYSIYSDAKQPKHRYISKEAKSLTKNEIKDLLRREHII